MTSAAVPSPSPRSHSPAPHRRPLAAGAVWMVLAALAAGCASAPIGRQPLTHRKASLVKEVREAGFEPAELTFPSDLTPQMRSWLDAEMIHRGIPRGQLQRLLHNLLDKDKVAVTYESGYTGTAQEVFENQTANCLAFTHLYVGLARELGLDAYYLDVTHFRRFEREKDLIVLSGHVTAGYGVPTDRLILEYDVGPDADYRYVKQIDDLRALAMYYSNRGAEVMQDGEYQQALDYLRTAVTLDPDLADGWVNYGVALRRLGEWESAAEAYNKALEVEPQAVSAYHNLATLMKLEGRHEDAQELLAVAERLGHSNPYNYLNLGDMHLHRGEVDQAERLYRKALNLNQDDAEAYAAMGILEYEQHHLQEARRWFKRAQKRDQDNPRVKALERRLYGEADGGTMARIVSSSEG